MPVVVSLLRAVNLGGRNLIRMDALRTLGESVGLQQARTHLQSGNIVSKTRERNMAALATRIEDAIEQTFGFRTDVINRTSSELRDVVARNPFATRADIDGSKLLVTFLAADPGDEARDKVRSIPAYPEEVFVDKREMYIYFPNGVGRTKLPAAAIERTLKARGTARNWNTVTKLLEIAQALK